MCPYKTVEETSDVNSWGFLLLRRVDAFALVLHSLAFIWVISFSSLIARAMFPLIFSFPDMNAMVGFSFPKMRNETENAALVPWGVGHCKNVHSKNFLVI